MEIASTDVITRRGRALLILSNPQINHTFLLLIFPRWTLVLMRTIWNFYFFLNWTHRHDILIIITFIHIHIYFILIQSKIIFLIVTLKKCISNMFHFFNLGVCICRKAYVATGPQPHSSAASRHSPLTVRIRIGAHVVTLTTPPSIVPLA